MIINNFDTNIIQVSENANFPDRNFTAIVVILPKNTFLQDFF